MTQKRVLELQTDDNKLLPAIRGQRLKHLRKMTGLSRRAFSEKHGLSPNTLQNWEDGKASGLTEQGARRMILALQEEGIQASTKWLLYGNGTKPFIFSDKIYEADASPPAEEIEIAKGSIEELTIMAELQAFRAFYKDTIDIIVNDDAMVPYFIPGDYVAGRKRYNEDIQSVYNQPCIVETTTGETYLRYLRGGTRAGYYTLLCSNLQTVIDEPVFNNIELISATPIIWHRRKDP